MEKAAIPSPGEVQSGGEILKLTAPSFRDQKTGRERRTKIKANKREWGEKIFYLIKRAPIQEREVKAVVFI